MKIIKYLLGTPAVALGGAYLIMAIWDRLIREEMLPVATFAWFPTVAVLWGVCCIVAASLLAAKSKGTR